MYTDNKLVSIMQKITLEAYSTHNTMLCRDKQTSLDTTNSTEQCSAFSKQHSWRKGKQTQSRLKCLSFLQDSNLPAGHTSTPCSQILHVPHCPTHYESLSEKRPRWQQIHPWAITRVQSWRHQQGFGFLNHSILSEVRNHCWREAEPT